MNINNIDRTLMLTSALMLFFPCMSSHAEPLSEKDAQGRQIIRGPVHAKFPNIIIENAHIVSDSYGVIAYGPVMISRSVIEARTCVQTSGNSLVLKDNVLDCGLGVEFTSGVLVDNQLSNNQYRGRLTNRPDVFGN